ncbi:MULTISPECIES: pilus assembly protein PilM [unclassified Paenibacillus]|uniref:pilus assembly protein PilM n=1 Tax=unclassified Paenibacillus TaxID=185978 RepID=UPI0030EDF82D
MLGLGPKVAGLSIEAAGIRYISFKNKQSWEVRKKRFLPLLPGMIIENQVADSEALYDRVRQWVKKEGLRGSKVSLSIPPSQIIIRKMSIPSTNDKQVEQLVKLEVETGLHLPFENPVYDYVTLEVDEEQSHLLVFAAPRKSIQDYVEILERAGLRISSVEISATALARAITTGHGESFAETMLINMEPSVMDIYMFRNGNPVFIRTINLLDLHKGRNLAGMDLLTDSETLAETAVAVEEHLSPEQMVEITAEISRMLSFYQYSLHDGSTRINNLVITGTPSIRKQLDLELQQSLAELEITPISLEQMASAAVSDPDLNDYRVAAGTALKNSINTDTIDLLPREDRETLLFPYVTMGLVAIWLLGMIGTGIYFSANKGQISNGKEQLQGLQDRSLMLQVELAKLKNSGPRQLDRKAAIIVLQDNKVIAVPILDELVGGLPKEALIRDINYTYRTSIDLTVNVSTMEDASNYLRQLRQMSFTADASIQKLTEGAADAISYNTYTAIYKVNLAAAKQQNSDTDASQGEVSSDGTDQ